VNAGSDTGLDPGWGWGAYILPYLEQEPLYINAGVATLPFGPPFPNPATVNAFTATILPVFRCPSDKGPDINDLRWNFATSKYRAVMGAISALGNPTFSYPNYVYGAFYADMDLGGVMFQNSTIRIINITDGTSRIRWRSGSAFWTRPAAERLRSGRG
jgi:hypothetical protein